MQITTKMCQQALRNRNEGARSLVRLDSDGYGESRILPVQVAPDKSLGCIWSARATH
jgi:hypothetical protein